MNLKAAYYAVSRMLLPTITVVILALMWSLDPQQTFSFLLSKSAWAGVLRIILLIAELVWFYYLYTKFVQEENIKEAIQSPDHFVQHRDGSLDEITHLLRDSYNIRYSSDRGQLQIKKSGDVFVIRANPKPANK